MVGRRGRLVLDSHLSTHLDAPSHFVLGGRTIDEIKLEELVGEAQALRASLAPDGRIKVKSLPAILAPRILLRTRWLEKHLYRPNYFRGHPRLDHEGAELLLLAGVRLLLIDTPSVDYDGEAHRTLLGSDCLIVENTARLGEVPEGRCHVTVLPLPIVGGDGCPVRAFAEPSRGTGS